jgi:predicted metal-dependent hydrolase
MLISVEQFFAVRVSVPSVALHVKRHKGWLNAAIRTGQEAELRNEKQQRYDDLFSQLFVNVYKFKYVCLRRLTSKRYVHYHVKTKKKKKKKNFYRGLLFLGYKAVINQSVFQNTGYQNIQNRNL